VSRHDKSAGAAAPEAPDLPGDLAPWTQPTLSHDEALREVSLTDHELPDQHASGVQIQGAWLTGVDLSGSRLDHLQITDAELRGCNLANVQAQRARAVRVLAQNSRLTGLHLPEAHLRDVTIRDCRVDLASFGFGRLERVTFEDCILTGTDFLEAQLESVRFHRCDLTEGDFRGARLQRCEFRRTNLTGLQGVEHLRGSAMEWPDIVEMAGVWAHALGIRVLDAD
jgi:uncharacterized protein YjbI with pentapeptide repeats